MHGNKTTHRQDNSRLRFLRHLSDRFKDKSPTLFKENSLTDFYVAFIYQMINIILKIKQYI